MSHVATPIEPIEQCRVGDCMDHGTWYPMLEVRPPLLEDTGSDPEGLYLNLPMCPAHAKRLLLADVLTDEAWAMVERLVAAIGKARPDRARTTVAVRFVYDRGVQQFLRAMKDAGV